MIGFSIPVFFVMFREVFIVVLYRNFHPTSPSTLSSAKPTNHQATETAIVVSVLLSFLNATFSHDARIRRSLSRRVWIGTALGILVSGALGATFLVLLYKYANNLWASAELIWEAAFSLLACVLLTIMSLAFLRYDTLAAKWTEKLGKAIRENRDRIPEGDFVSSEDERVAKGVVDLEDGEKTRNASAEKVEGEAGTTVVDTSKTSFAVATSASDDATVSAIVKRAAPAATSFWAKVLGKRSLAASFKDVDSDDDRTLVDSERKLVGFGAMVVIPFITVLREGLEGIVFLAGFAISEDPGTIPIAVIVGLLCGMIIGFLLYRYGNTVNLHVFFVSASILLLVLAAGLLSKAVMSIETHIWAIKVNALEDPDALDSFDTTRALWKLECCKASTPGWWSLVNAITGWDNHATISSVVSYCMYWVLLAIGLVVYKVLVLRPKAREAAAAKTRAAIGA
ncbi:high-affinity iron permease [Dinochytrium kinnereticum]|nr:high-affinity iron permease [Dinochytrium kinnereticum]